MELSIANASLGDLAVLIGRWRVEVSRAEFLSDGEVLGGTMHAEWMDGAALVVSRTLIDGGPPAAVQVIGRNESGEDDTVLYADDRGVSRVYAMSLHGREWLSRSDPGFLQRFEGHIAEDGTRIDAEWSKSHDDGATWLHDFDVTYIKE